LRFEDSSHHVVRLFAVDEDPLPHFEVHEQPEPVAVRPQTAVVLDFELLDGTGAEQSARERPVTENEFVDDR